MAHRDDFSKCPTCATALDPQGSRFVCGKCTGAFVTNGELELMMNEMSPDDERPLVQRLLAGAAPPRTCPRCPTMMGAHTMYGVTIDRCAEHGVWFDGNELAAVLNANGQAYAARNHENQPSMSLGGILGQTIRALFAPRIKKARLARDIARTSPKPPDPKP